MPTFSLIFSLILSLCLTSTVVDAKRGLINALFNPPTPIINGTYKALVIGNNDYQDPEQLWKPLKTAVNDAKSIASTLENYGFEVTLLTNGNRRTILKAFNHLIKKQAKANDSILIYYAGHGYLDEQTKEGYWIPVDAEGRDDSSFIRNSTIKAKLAVLAETSRHVMLISDSCFSGDLLRNSNRGVSLDEKNQQYIHKVAKKRSVQVLAAGGLEFVDDNYKSSGHSPFTYFLLNELQDNNLAYLTATELSSAVKRTVGDNVSQTPEHGVLFGAGHEGGELIFASLVEHDPQPTANKTGQLTILQPIRVAHY